MWKKLDCFWIKTKLLIFHNLVSLLTSKAKKQIYFFSLNKVRYLLKKKIFFSWSLWIITLTLKFDDNPEAKKKIFFCKMLRIPLITYTKITGITKFWQCSSNWNTHFILLSLKLLKYHYLNCWLNSALCCLCHFYS